MKGIAIFGAALALSTIPALGAEKAPKLSKADLIAIASSPQDIADIVAVKNDDFDTVIRLSTEPFYTQKSGFLKLVSGDKFIRAIIDKKTGDTTFQIYIWSAFTGEWDRWTHLSYKVGDELKTAIAEEIDSTVGGCSAYGCVKRVDMAFKIPEADLRDAAKDAQANTDRSWPFKLFTRKSGDAMNGMMETEIAGLLLAVDAQRSKSIK